jgi:hypothetical protein
MTLSSGRATFRTDGSERHSASRTSRDAIGVISVTVG